MPYKDPAKREECNLLSYHRYKEKRNEQRRERHRKMRQKIISHYSNGKNECACCHETTFVFLAIDHIAGGGTKHIETLSSRSIERFLIKNNFPSGYQVLCHNCNFGKHIFGQCPHKLNGEKPKSEETVLKTVAA